MEVKYFSLTVGLLGNLVRHIPRSADLSQYFVGVRTYLRNVTRKSLKRDRLCLVPKI